MYHVEGYFNCSGTVTFQCNCQPGTLGTLCETNTNECSSNPCYNHATCVDGYDSFICLCPPGYSGTLCQTEINECASNPCHPIPVAMDAYNPSVCIDGLNSYSCDCIVDYVTGNNCQTVISQCTSSLNPCLHGGTCVESFNGHVSGCVCLPGFANSTICDPCPINTFSESSSNQSCAECPIGTYQPLTGQTSCSSLLLLSEPSSSSSSTTTSTPVEQPRPSQTPAFMSDTILMATVLSATVALSIAVFGIWTYYLIQPSTPPIATSASPFEFNEEHEHTPLFIRTSP